MKVSKSIKTVLGFTLMAITFFLFFVETAKTETFQIGPILQNDIQISPSGGASSYSIDVSSNGSNYLVVWRKYGGGIVGQFVDTSGNLVGGEFLISESGGYCSIASNGIDYFVVYGIGYPEYIIAGRIVTSDGIVKSQQIIGPAGYNYPPDVAYASNSKKFLVTWTLEIYDKTNDHYDIYGRIVSDAGIPELIVFPIIEGPPTQTKASVASNGTEFFVVWENQNDDGQSTRDIYGARVDSAANVLDTIPIAICTAISWQNLNKAKGISFNTLTNNYLVVWRDDRYGYPPHIYGARISSTGELLDFPSDTGGIDITGYNYSPDVGFDGTNWLTVWGSGSRTWGSRISGLGEVIDPGGVRVSWATTTTLQNTLAYDGNNFLLIWYVNEQNPGYTIYGQLVSTQISGNQLPIADAADDQTVEEGTLVVLNGSGSSDPDNDPLTYIWLQIDGPSVSLDLTDPIHPSFTAPLVEVGGATLTFQLTVSDGVLTGEQDSVNITVKNVNIPPIADAGNNQSVHPGSMVSLDGSASSDPDEDYPLTYTWTMISRPTGSSASLIIADPSIPSFEADVLGDYTIELVVTDSKGLSSAADQVLVSTFNTPPVADAGEDQVIIQVGATVKLDGNQSYDDEGDDFTYLWTITDKPTESIAELDDLDSSTPTFIADIQGDYVISLTVTDIFDAVSETDSITVSFENVKPVADAGGNQSVIVGDTVFLDGNGSSDNNFDPLSYSWSFVSKPFESLAELSNANVVNPSLIVDKPGAYVVSLVVNDTFVDSDPANVTIMAITTEEAVAITLIETVERVNLLDPESLKNKNLSNALTNKINAALAMIDEGLYEDALDKLENDILGKTNGCAETGTPDKNDWIKTCDAQNQIYPQIVEVIELLRDII